MTTNPLPYSIGFICGFLAALFALLIEYIMRTREPADMPHHVTDCHTDSTPPLDAADDDVEFSTSMTSFEWADAVIEELRRKYEDRRA